MARADLIAAPAPADAPSRLPATGTAGLAHAGLLFFVVLVYANPGVWLFPASGDLGIAKAAAAAALLALFGSALFADRPLLVGGAIGLLLLGFFLWVGASAAWSLWPAMTVDTFLDGLKYLAIFFLVANTVDSPGRADGLIRVIAWSSLVPALGAINAWAHGEHLVEGDRAAWIGIFANPNDLAYHLVVGVALCLGARERTRARLTRAAYLGAMAVMGTALLLTQSRGGLLATGVVLGLWTLRGLRRGSALAGVAALLVLAGYFAPRATIERAETISNYQEDASAEGRIDAWRTGLNVFRDRPLTGVGAGAFLLGWPEFAPGDAGPPRSAHNTFVQVLAETGLPSLALFVGAIAVGIFGVRRGERDELQTLGATVQAGLCGYLCCSLTGGLAYSWPLYLLLGLGAALRRMETPVAPPEPSPEPMGPSLPPRFPSRNLPDRVAVAHGPVAAGARSLAPEVI